MVTIIVYINGEGIIDQEYLRVFDPDRENERNEVLAVKADGFLRNPGAYYKRISEYTKGICDWRLIWADDRRIVCEKAAGSPSRDPCPDAVDCGRTNPFESYDFGTILQVLCGKTRHPDYTATIPKDIFVLKTRGDLVSCKGELTEDGVNVLVPDVLPANARYLVYEFYGKGEYLWRENEWKLIFVIWAMCKGFISVEYMKCYQLYRITVSWDKVRLGAFVAELTQQLDQIESELKSLKIPSAEKAHWLEGCGNGRHYRTQNGEIARGKKLRNIKAEIEREGEIGFRKIRSQDWRFKQTSDATVKDYESILLNHYIHGTEDLGKLEDEGKELEHALKGFKIFRKLFKSAAGVFLVAASSGALTEGPAGAGVHMLESIEIAAVFAAVYIITAFFNNKICRDNKNYLDIYSRYHEIHNRIEDVLNGTRDRINLQFEKMVDYKQYLEYCHRVEREEKKHREIRKDHLKLEQDIRNAREFCRKLGEFADAPGILPEMNNAAPIQMRSARYYPIDWERKKNVCMIQGQPVQCHYYFLTDITWSLVKEDIRWNIT